MVSEKEVLEVLKECYDPEIPVNIVDLGLIYKLKVGSEKISIMMTLTAPGCPFAPQMIELIKSKLSTLKVRDIDVQIVWDPPWSPERMSEAARLQLGL